MKLSDGASNIDAVATGALDLIYNALAEAQFRVGYGTAIERTRGRSTRFGCQPTPQIFVLAVHNGVEAFLVEDPSHLLVQAVANKWHVEIKYISIFPLLLSASWLVVASCYYLSRVAIFIQNFIEGLKMLFFSGMAGASLSDSLFFIPDDIHFRAPR